MKRLRALGGLAALAALAVGGAAAGATNGHPAWLEVASGRAPPGLAATLDRAALADARERELRELGAGHAELLWRAEIRIAADGSIVERVTHVRRFLDAVGIGQGGDVLIGVQPSFETLTIEHAGVRLADGRTFAIEPHTVQVTAGEQPGIFSDRRSVTIPLPALTDGATGVVVYTRRYRGDAWPLAWSWHLPLQSGAPVERYEVDVSWDAAAPAPAWRTSDPGLACDLEGERRLRCAKSQAPPLEPDPDVRTGADVVPEFVLAEPQTWEEAARDVGALVEERQDLPPGTLREVLEGAGLGDGELDDAQKWKALYRFVADDVRYLGLEHGANAVVPRPPATTLARRFGDCKDKVTLFVALARAAGLPAVPVLVASERFDPDALLLPNVNYFDHMIACWDEPRLEAEACADLTVRGLTPADSVQPLRDRVALPLREGTREPTTLSGSPFGWRVEVEGVTRLHCDGSTETRVERRLHGGARRFFRETYGALTVAQRRRFLADEHWRATSSPLVPEIRVGGVHDADGPVSVSTAISTPPAQPLFNGYQHADDDPWVRAYGLLFRSDNRHYDAWMPGLEVHSVHRYEVCEDFRAALLGPTLVLESELGSLERQYWSKRDGEEIVVETVLELPGAIHPPEALRSLNRLLDNGLDQLTIWFSLSER